MTQKDFIALVKMIRDSEPLSNSHARAGSERVGARIQWEIMRDKLADFCATQNPQFDRARFLQACGVE